MVKNSAFVFIKPHAVTDKVKELVAKTFEEKGFAIKKEGGIEADEIDKKMLIDQHYYAIAAKATILTPDKLEVPKEKFKDKYGVEFADCLKDGTALNAKQAVEKFGVDAIELEKIWRAGDQIKFGGGFYCSKLEGVGPAAGEGPFYVFNGFFMSMREKYVAAGVSIYYYVVEWESETCDWADFRGKVLGPTDPSKAPADSLRGNILTNWKELGLKAEPSTADNSMHASASPFEALSERMNWLGYRAERDYFGKLLLYKAGVTRRQIKEWCEDPQVTYGPSPITRSLFDSLEDTDSDWCLALCQMIGGHCQPKESGGDLEKEIAKLKAEIDKLKPLADAVMTVKGYKETKLPKAPAKKEKEEPPSRTRGDRGGGSKGSKGGKGAVEDKRRGYQDEPPRSKGKGKGKGKVEDEPRGKGGKSKGGKGGRDRDERDYYSHNDPPPLRQRPKGKGGDRDRDRKGKGKGKGKY